MTHNFCFVFRQEGAKKAAEAIFFPSTDSEMQISWLYAKDIGMLYKYFYLHLRGDSYTDFFLICNCGNEPKGYLIND